MKLSCGFGSGGSASQGLEGLPGLLFTIAFMLIFAGIFLPHYASDWYLVLFLGIEIGAAVLYILLHRRDRRESDSIIRELHRINEAPHPDCEVDPIRPDPVLSADK